MSCKPSRLRNVMCIAVLLGAMAPHSNGLRAQAAWLSNISVRTIAGSGSQTLVVGFVIGGAGTSGSKTLLVRAVGPSLVQYIPSGLLPDPQLTLFGGPAPITNFGWGGNPQVIQASAAVGAFALPSVASMDSALLASALAPGAYTAQVTSPSGAAGIALLEAYDVTPASSFTASTPHLVDVSARAQVGTGNDVLVAGFYIGGSGNKAVLVRGVGPTLTRYAVSGVLAAPKLDLLAGATVLQSNTGWGNAQSLASAADLTGAFQLTPSSRDSAVIAALPSGSAYTAMVSGVGGTTGVALIEVYELPPAAPSIVASSSMSSSNFHASGSYTFSITATQPYGLMFYQLLVNGTVIVPWQTDSTLVWRPDGSIHGGVSYTLQVKDPYGPPVSQSSSSYVYRSPPLPL